jgi:glyoxylase-like metal-dependent hydrolase (beta-lactamase superfamily II)
LTVSEEKAMKRRVLLALMSCGIIALAVWFGSRGLGNKAAPDEWEVVAPGIWRSAGLPAGYALIDGDTALLIDAPRPPDGLRARGVKKIEAVLLTHHHRDSLAALSSYLKEKVPVRAAKESAEWLTPDHVRKHWQESLPLRNSRTAYLVVPEGFDGIKYDLTDGLSFDWHGWKLQVVATPGHSRDHLSFTARRDNADLLVFAGDALAGYRTIWSPYTTDWDHWTDLGLKPAEESLRKLYQLKPDILLPAHGDVVNEKEKKLLMPTLCAIHEAGFQKSFERYSKKQLGNPPSYTFLAREQAGSAGEKPWSRISEHLWVTGNTFVLVSKDNAILVVDPWGKRSADQVQKLQKEQKLGAVERVWFSHAHYDHYDGIFDLPERDKFQTWALEEVAKPLAEPGYYRAPFLDARPVKIDRRFKDGESASWREYSFRFHHFPGQTYFTMAVETAIDGKKCLFTADNFFHIDLFSGSGGWMGLNRSWPEFYAASAQKILDIHPDWVLAEHGGAFEFNAEDIRRRVRWGEEAARACDILSPTGQHRHDWDPHRVRVEPVLHAAKAGATLSATLVVDNPLPRPRTLSIVLEGRGQTPDQHWDLTVAAAGSVRRVFTLPLDKKLSAGRHIFTLRTTEGNVVDPADSFVAVDIQP